MPAHVEHVNNAFPHGFTLEPLRHRDDFSQGRTAVVKTFDSLTKFATRDLH